MQRCSFRSTLRRRLRQAPCGPKLLNLRGASEMTLLKHEFIDVASRPLLWIGTLVFCAFLLHAVGHLGIEEDKVDVAVYQTRADSPDTVKWFRPARSLLQEMANVEVREPVIIGTDV